MRGHLSFTSRIRLLFLVTMCCFGIPIWTNQNTIVAPSQGNLTVHASSNDLNGQYTNRGRIIYFETIRGMETSLEVRLADSTATLYEIDTRFMDGNGQ